MSPRKRREPPSPISPRRSPKRLRAPPAPWNHSEKAANPSTGSVGAACRYTAGGPYYGIKAILDERDGKYLVDWSDDLNGITYEPDWQPKRYLNAAALSLWKTSNSQDDTGDIRNDDQSPPKTPLFPRNPRGKPPPLRPVTRSSAAASAAHTHTNGHTHESEPPKENKPQAPQLSQKSVQSVSPSVDTSKFPGVSVQIPPDDVDREAYSTYQSSHQTLSIPHASLSSLQTQSTVFNRLSSPSDQGHSDQGQSDHTWFPDHQSQHSLSTREDRYQSEEQASTGERNTTFSSSPARTSDLYATIPDSQSLPRSPKIAPSSKNITLPAEQGSQPLKPTDAGQTVKSVSLELAQQLGPIRRFVQAPEANEKRVHPRHPHSALNHILNPTDEAPLYHRPSGPSGLSQQAQIPNSVPDHTVKASQNFTQPADHIVIPQTQDPTQSEIFHSLESVNNKLVSNIHTSSQSKTMETGTGQETTPIHGASDTTSAHEQTNRHPQGSGSLSDRINRRLAEARAKTTAQLAADKERRMQATLAKSIGPATSKPIEPIEVNAAPSTDHHGLISPSGLRSPLDVRISTPSNAQSPQSIRSTSQIPEKLPYYSQEEQSYLGVEPSGIAQDVPVPLQFSRSSDGGGSSQTVSSLPATSLDIYNLGPMEYIVPLAMPPRTQNQYIETYRFYHRRIQKFLGEKDPDKPLLEDLNLLLERVGKVTTHMDLDGGGPASQEEVDVEEEALYAESCSEKFRFLGLLLERLRADSMNIAIFARKGQLLDFIETFLKAKKVNYFRHDTSTKSEGERTIGDLHVSLFESRPQSLTPTPWHAQLVIAFDETFDASDIQVSTIRASPDSNRFSPIIRLVVYGSLEHITLCLPITLDPLDRLRRLIFCMIHTEKVVGHLISEANGPSFEVSSSADAIVAFLNNDCSPYSWEVAKMPTLESIPMDSDSSLSDAVSDISDEYKPDGPVRYWPNPVLPKLKPAAVRAGVKRPYNHLEYGDSLQNQAKKLKYGQLVHKRRALGHSTMPPPDILEPPEDVSEKIQKLEEELASQRDIVKDYAAVFAVRQSQFESDRDQIADLTSANEQLTVQLSKRTTENESLKTANAELKTSLKEKQAELDAARLDIRTNPVYETTHPNLVARERDGQKIRDLESENKTLKLRSDRLEGDFNFVRQQYQTASSAAAEAQTTLETMKDELIATKIKADDVRIRLKEARDRDVTAALRKEVSRLREMVKMRDREVREREIELRELKRGRQGVMTRGSSVQPPSGMRSPRAGSRGVSPAVMAGHGPTGSGGVGIGAGGPTGILGVANGGGVGSGAPGHGGVAMSRGLSGLSHSQRYG